MAATRAPKAPTNYAKLAEETELLLDGIRARSARQGFELNRLLKDVPERAVIRQMFERYAVMVAQEQEIAARFERYVALRDRKSDDAESSKA